MAERTTIGTILSSSNSVEILIHIHENPGCRMSEIYREITRNAHTRESEAYGHHAHRSRKLRTALAHR